MTADPFPVGSVTPAPAGGKPRVVRFELSLKSLATVLGLIAGIWLVIHALPILLVLVAALMLVGAVNPLVAWLVRRRMPRFPAISIVFGLGAALVLALAILTVPTVIAQVRDVAEHEAEIRGKVADYLARAHLTAALAEGIRNVHYAELLKSSGTTLLLAGTRALEIAAYGVAAVFLAFYMMIDHDRLRGALFAVVPRSHHIRLSRILLNLGTIVGGYIRGQVLTCFLMGGFILVLLLACGVPNALAIAVFGGVMDLLPYLGIFLTMGPAVLAAAGQGPAIAGTVFVLMLAYEELESRVLVPLVYGRAMRLPSSVVLFSLIVGTALAGIVGALLALPLASAVLMLVDELRVELPGESIQPADLAQQRADNRGEQEYERRTEHLTAEKASAVAVEISGIRKQAEGEAEKAAAAASGSDKAT
jgi:predicted PurR-regulated permease PerM